MAGMTDRRDWHREISASIADRLIDGIVRLFVTEPVAASAGVLLVVGAISNSGLAAFLSFVIASLFAWQLQARRLPSR